MKKTWDVRAMKKEYGRGAHSLMVSQPRKTGNDFERGLRASTRFNSILHASNCPKSSGKG